MNTETDLLPLPSGNVAHLIAAQSAEIEALRAEVEAWRELSDHVHAGACKAIWPDRYTDERTRDVAAALKRAARMEEALREAEEHINALTPEWYSAGQRVLATIRAALYQESKP